jgi:NADPH:quinone reductase-like Zn-dependent oxidoreductase
VVAEVGKITKGKGARIAFDPVGGPTVTKLAQALARFGVLFEYAALSTEPTTLPLLDLLGKSLIVRGTSSSN